VRPVGKLLRNINSESMAKSAEANANSWRQDAVAARERLNPQPSTRKAPLTRRAGNAGLQESGGHIDGDDLFGEVSSPVSGGIGRGRLINAKRVQAKKQGLFGRLGSFIKSIFGK